MPFIPQINFMDLQSLTSEQRLDLKRKGCLIIRDVVEDAQATAWKTGLDEFVKINPTADGFPEGNKQFFNLYWTKPQVQARQHPNVLAASAWLNNLFHTKSDKKLDGVDLSTPLSYADRFRMRQPGGYWDAHPPHVDGGGIERWEDPAFRAVFGDILAGVNWREHDPYDIEARLEARTSTYGRKGQASCFRTFQGWLAMTQISPGNGTLQLFPDIVLSNAYLILRPFFRPASPALAQSMDAKDWVFDTSDSDWPAIVPGEVGFLGPYPTAKLHPHLRLDGAMTSIPTVRPGDMVFWHCDMIHAVEPEHTGQEDSAVMYIGAVPTTPHNTEHIKEQLPTFLAAAPPPDYPQGVSEAGYIGIGLESDVVGLGRAAMGLAY
ncbi:hypothetical protein HWV62_109 [Athelia sp. TMB]|nr:hypothetical protein HWV62_109 [Athelia sp. TMB]